MLGHSEEATVSTLIRRPAAVIDANATLWDAVRLMATQKVDALVVIEDGRPLGLLTQRALINAWHQERPPSTPAVSLMIARMVQVAADAHLTRGRLQELSAQQGPVAVIDTSGGVIGLLEAADLAAAASRLDADLAEDESQTLRRLRQSEQTLRQAQAVGQIGSWSLDLQRGHLDWSEQTYHIFGREPGSPVDYALFLSCVHPDDRDAVEQAWQQALKGLPYAIEHRVLLNDRVRWVRERAELQFDAQGRALSGVGTVQDVTERKQVELRLQGLMLQLNRLSHLATALISSHPASSAHAIRTALGDLAALVGADRAFVYECGPDADAARLSFEWSDQGTQPLSARLPCESLSGIASWLQQQGGDQPLVIEDVAPLSATEMRRLGVAWDVQSLVRLPMMGRDGCIGCVGFDSVRSPRSYEDEVLELLGLLVRILVNHHDRSLTQARLQESEANFRNFFSTITDFLFILDAQGQIIHANSAVMTRLDYSHEQLIGQSVLVAHPADRREEAKGIVAKMVAGQLDTCPVPLCTRHGEIIPVETRVVSGQWNGQPALFGVCRDISELAASEEKFAKVFHLSPMAMAITDLDDGRLIDVNEAFGQFTGYAPSQAIGRTSADLKLFADPQLRADLIERVLQGEAIRGVEVEVHRPDGSPRSGLLSATSLHLQGHRLMLSQMLDITEPKAAERALRAERGLLRALIDNLPDLVWLKDLNGTYLACNPRFEQFFGRPEAEIVGGTDFDFVDQATAQLFQHHDRKALELGQPHQNEETLTFAESGYKGLFTTMKTPVRDTAGRLVGVLGVAREITREREAEERTRLAADVFYHAHEGIMICDAALRIVEVNPFFTEISGYPASEVLGKRPGFLDSGRHSYGFYRAMWRTINTEGSWQDEIWHRHRDGHAYACLMTVSKIDDRAAGRAQYICVFSDVTLNKIYQEKLEHLAHFDPLTGLPNRVALAVRMQQAMAQARQQKQLLAVCYLDLDDFKPINDQYGHSVGDRLLVAITKRLLAVVRSGDTVARLGGDEFVLLLSHLASSHDCDQATLRVLSTIMQPVVIEGKRLQVSGSIGITLFPDDAADADGLLRHADQAMYLAKTEGRNRARRYDPALDQVQHYRHQELLALERALETAQLQLYFQPKVNMRQGKVVGAEALIRWQHPERGLLTPGQFLPALSGHALEQAVDWWVLHQALRQMSAWHQCGFEMPISVNLTGASLLQEGFVERLGVLLQGHPEVLPKWLELEVLETAALEDVRKVEGIFRQCQLLGVRIALDDFGTGYSSLAYFRRLPADTLKIDQLFVRDMLNDAEDLAIVESVIGLTQAFNRHVVAEGLEDLAAGVVLLELGCDVVQGFGIAEPMHPEQLPQWVDVYRPAAQWQRFLDGARSSEHLSLALVGLEHQQWMQRIRDLLDGRSGSTDVMRLLSAKRCRFGRWYIGEGARHFGHLDEFQAIERSHDEVHQQGERLIGLCQAGRRDEAREGFPALEASNAEMMQQVDALRRLIATRS